MAPSAIDVLLVFVVYAAAKVVVLFPPPPLRCSSLPPRPLAPAANFVLLFRLSRSVIVGTQTKFIFSCSEITLRCCKKIVDSSAICYSGGAARSKHGVVLEVKMRHLERLWLHLSI